MYLDMELLVKNATTGEERQITEADGLITIVITIPDELYSNNKNYSVVRVHNGIADNIGGELNRKNKTLTIKTNKFSTYALTSVRIPTEPDNSNPYTSASVGVITLAALAAATFAEISRKKKKEKEQ